jgi:hypothetical protein
MKKWSAASAVLAAILGFSCAVASTKDPAAGVSDGVRAARTAPEDPPAAPRDPPPQYALRRAPRPKTVMATIFRSKPRL